MNNVNRRRSGSDGHPAGNTGSHRRGGAAVQRPGNSHARSQGNSAIHNLLTVIGVVMCIVLIPLLVMNVTLIVKSYTSDEVPSVGGHLPLIVLTDSMYPEIQSGDLIICNVVEPEEVAEGDVIAFFDPAGNGESIVTHRVLAVTELDGGLAWQTKGDANNVEDRDLVPAENLVAEWGGFRIPGLGDVAMFMQTVPGLIVCVVLPLLLLIGYDIIRRRMYEKKHSDENELLMRELEELRAQKAAMAAREREDALISPVQDSSAYERPRSAGAAPSGSNNPRRRASHARPSVDDFAEGEDLRV